MNYHYIMIIWKEVVLTLFNGIFQPGGRHIFEKLKSYLKILATRMITRSNFHTYGPQILGVTVQNSVAQATFYTGFVCP